MADAPNDKSSVHCPSLGAYEGPFRSSGNWSMQASNADELELGGRHRHWMSSLEVDVGRCLCVHSSFQAVDVAFQSILYKRGFAPAPFSQVTACAESRDEQTFVAQYNKIRESLRELFRSCNGHHLRSVVLLIGGCHMLPKELYRFPIRDCHLPDLPSGNGCCSKCSELSKKEVRQMCLSLTVDFDLSEMPHLPQEAYAYVMVSVSTAARYPPELFTPYEDFELPSEKKAKERHMLVSYISFKHHCPSAGSEYSSQNDESIWLRLDPVLHRLNA
ncbi:Uncharacterized protein C41D11.5 [Toxocara canis]|uniref:Uncharacterized protein C41D11.5 n=1 Tax=Toxocara canis TaxID=6265 RepID=A0A0B2W2C2_TOXCA|nr:Uncharacterized protein C41D11.5 [Toxocara canis]